MKLAVISAAIMVVAFTGCESEGGGSQSAAPPSYESAATDERSANYQPPPPPEPTRVVDDTITIAEGAGNVWRVSPGSYRVRVVASPDGAKTTWSGASDCQGSRGEQKEFETRCIVSADAQLTIQNPGKWGVGPDIIVAVIVERLP